MHLDSPRPYQIILLDDSTPDIELIRYQFKKGKVATDWTVCDTEQDFLTRISQPFDLVISDVNMPGFGAYRVLEILSRIQPTHPPLVVISGAVGEEVAVEVMRAGAKDFVVKSNLQRLVSASLRAIRESRLERIEIEQTARAEKAVRDRERLLEVVSHDLKNPLGAINLNVDLLRRALKNPEQNGIARSNELLDRIQRSAQRVDHLVRDILDQAKIEAGRFRIEATKSDISQLISEVREVFEPLCAEKGIVFLVGPNLTGALRSFDRERVHQVISNLISNAVKFTPSGGSITLTIDDRSNQIHFSVRDTGPGISIDDQDAVFTKFWQASSHQRMGSGLGLSIAREIVRAHDGQIGVKSDVGEGAEFWFTIPIRPDVEATSTETTGRTWRLLLLEDDEDLREGISEVLMDAGYDVRAFETPGTALTALRSGLKADMFLVDHDLPEMSGVDFIKRCRLEGLVSSETKLVLTSAHPDLRERAEAISVAYTLSKPFDLERLESQIAELR